MFTVGKRVPGSVVSVLLSVLMFILVCFFIIMMLTSVSNALLILNNAEITELLENTEFAYYFVTQLNSLPFNDYTIVLSDIEDFLKLETVSDEIGRVLNNYVSAINRNDLDYHLTTRNMLGIIQNLEMEVNRMFGLYMTTEEQILLARTLDDVLDFRGMTVSGILYDVGIGIMVPRLLLSPYSPWIAITLMALTMSLILLIKIKTIPDAFLLSGIPIALSGFLFLLTGLIFGPFQEILTGSLRTLSRLIGIIMDQVIRYGIIFTAIGAALIVAYLVFKKKNKALNNRKVSRRRY